MRTNRRHSDPSNIDAAARPLLELRACRMLPYLGEDALYKEFKLDEPWDSEHNRKLLARMPAVFKIDGSMIPIRPTTWRLSATIACSMALPNQLQSGRLPTVPPRRSPSLKPTLYCSGRMELQPQDREF